MDHFHKFTVWHGKVRKQKPPLRAWGNVQATIPWGAGPASVLHPRVIINVINSDRFLAKLLVYSNDIPKHVRLDLIFTIFFIFKKVKSVYKYECLNIYHISSFGYNCYIVIP